MTVTIVGYGDKYPITAGGRGVAVILMVIGIGLIGVVTATVASYFVEEKANEDEAELVERLDRIEGMIAEIIGSDKFVATANDSGTSLWWSAHATMSVSLRSLGLSYRTNRWLQGPLVDAYGRVTSGTLPHVSSRRAVKMSLSLALPLS